MIEKQTYTPPTEIRFAGRVIQAKPEHIPLLGKTMEDLLGLYPRALNAQQQRVVRALERVEGESVLQGASGIDYLFLRHHAGESLRDLSRDIQISHNTLGKIFRRLELPYLDKAASMKIAKSPRPEDIAALEDLIRENLEVHQADPNYRLLSNPELAELLGASRSYTAQIVRRTLQPEVLRYREQQIRAQSSSELGKRMRDKGRGIFGVNPDTGVPYGVEAAALGGRKSRELGLGVHAQTLAERRAHGRAGGISAIQLGVGLHAMTHQEHQNAGRAGGTISRQRRLGFFAITPQRRSAISSRNGMALRDQGRGIFGLTDEQRSEIGRAVGLRMAELGLGCHGVDPETGILYSVIGAQRARELGVGVHALTPEDRSHYGMLGSEIPNSAKIYTERGEYFDSYMEAAVAFLLERYVPGFRIIRGETYQVQTGSSKKVDFYIGNTFIEYNPILLTHTEGSLGAFETAQEHQEYVQALAEVPRNLRAQFKDRIRQVLKDRYTLRRRVALDENPDHRDRELIVVIDPVEFYEDVLQRFGRGVPDIEGFLQEFAEVTENIKEDDARIKSERRLALLQSTT